MDTATYLTQGAIKAEGALSAEALALAQTAYDWSLANPGPGAAQLPNREGGEFYQDLANPTSFAAYDDLVRHADITDLVRSVFQGDSAWFMYEQVFKKHGGTTRRTPWHQDTPYLPVNGQDLLVIWISFDEVAEDAALEFIAGSHMGEIYDGSRFDPKDDTAPLYNDPSYPRLPDIESHRSDYEVISWPSKPGDAVLFHPSTLHGGAPTQANASRRTLSLRFFGEDAVVAERPGAKVANPNKNSHPLNQVRGLKPGTPFRHPEFPRIF